MVLWCSLLDLGMGVRKTTDGERCPLDGGKTGPREMEGARGGGRGRGLKEGTGARPAGQSAMQNVPLPLGGCVPPIGEKPALWVGPARGSALLVGQWGRACFRKRERGSGRKLGARTAEWPRRGSHRH